MLRSPTEPIRVCLVAPSLAIVGGQSVQADRLLRRLRSIPGLSVTFVPHNPRLPGVLTWLQRVKYLRTLLTEATYLVLLVTTIRRHDVVHVFSASYFSFLLAPAPALVIARLFRKPIVLNYHSGEAEDHLLRWRRTSHPIVRLADRVIVPSRYLVDVFRKFGFRAHAIPNFVDAEQFARRDRRRLRPAFLMNRHLEPHYNIACGLRAFGRIQREIPSARLVVAGDGSCRTELERLSARLGLQNVEFPGRVAPQSMAHLYANADIFLNSSSTDNQPLSILEAFAAGLAVVTTRAGGIGELVAHEETGMLVELDDDASLASAALRLLHDHALACRMIERARTYCEEHYGWPAVAGAWLAVYAELSGRGGRDDPFRARSKGAKLVTTAS